MGLPQFFKTAKYNEFTYIPRYYNKKKEAREQRNAEILTELKTNKEKSEYHTLEKGQMRSYFNERNKAGKSTNIRLVIITAVLFMLAYFLIYY